MQSINELVCGRRGLFPCCDAGCLYGEPSTALRIKLKPFGVLHPLGA